MYVKMTKRHSELIDIVWPYIGKDGELVPDAPEEIKKAREELRKYSTRNDRYYQ